MGYGWTDNWATSLSSASPVPGSIYSLDGLATDTGNGSGATRARWTTRTRPCSHGGNVYIVDTAGNRVEEVPGSSGTQWGISMTAGDMYTIAGSPTGAYGDSADGTPNERPVAGRCWNTPAGWRSTRPGTCTSRTRGTTGCWRSRPRPGRSAGIAMTANDMYTVAGNCGGSSGHSGDGGAATSAFLNDPVGLAVEQRRLDLYIADAGNNRVQEVAAENGTQWGPVRCRPTTSTPSPAARRAPSGCSGDGGAATSALLDSPEGLACSSAGDLYIADTGNNRIQEIPAASRRAVGHHARVHRR